MPFSPHALVSLGGNWGAGNADAAKETWNFGIRLTTGTPAGGYLGDPQAYANKIGPGIKTWWAAASSSMSQYALLQYIKVNNILPNGKYKDPITHQYLTGLPVGGAGSHTQNGILSLAWTFRTDLGRGRAGHGRVYPPNPCYTMTSGIFSTVSANATLQLTAAKAFLSILLAQLDGTTAVAPCVASRIGGEIGVIQSVEVDTIYDVQRRRKKRAIGTRVSSVWP